MLSVWLVVGPERAARRYARQRGWSEAFYTIVSSAEEMRLVDPPDLIGVALVDVDRLDPDQRVCIDQEIVILNTAWPEIPVLTAVSREPVPC